MAIVLPMRVDALEKARADVVADEGHGGVAADFFVGDAAAAIHLNVVDHGDGVGDALDADGLLGGAFVGDARLAGDHHAEILEEGGVVLDELVLLGPELGVAFLHFEEFLGVEISEKGHADDAEAVGAHIGDLVGDVDIHAMDERRDGDQGGGGENDAQEREETAQLIIA